MKTQPFELGEKVIVRAEVSTTYSTGPDAEIIHSPPHSEEEHDFLKKLVRRKFNKPREGIIVGYTYRATGRWESFVDSCCLVEDKRHKVWMIATTLRYTKPILALEKDIEKYE